MGFFKENKHVDGTTSTDWGGSIAGGFGGMGGFTILIGVAMLYTYWIYAVAFLVIVLIAWGSWKYILSPKSTEGMTKTESIGNKRKAISILLALIGGGIGLNNFYNNRYVIGIIKLVLFSFSAFATSEMHNPNDIGIMVMKIMPVLIIIGWIEALLYLFKSGEEFKKKEDAKNEEQLQKKVEETPVYSVEKQNIIDEMKVKGFSFNHKKDIFNAHSSPASCKLLFENGQYMVSDPA